jgi:SAM-dependent methyltransferase
MNRHMAARAAELADWLVPHLPSNGLGLDVGAGTGHNRRAFEQRSRVRFVELDVVAFQVIRGSLVQFDGWRLPFQSASFSCAVAIYVFTYCYDPVALLREIRRSVAGPLLVVQSSYRDHVGHWALQFNDWLWGPMAFQVARWVGFVDQQQHALRGYAYYSRERLGMLFGAAGWHFQVLDSWTWPWAAVQTDLYLLQESR